MKKKLVLFAFLFSAVVVYSQKMKVSDGSFKNLKGITSYNLEFDYSDVQIPKYDSEEEFLEDKMAKREKKEAGTGEKFKKSWFDDRANRYHPKYVESFNKRFDDGKVKVGVDVEDAKYIMKIHTTKLYAGYNVGIVRHNSEIDATVTIYEAANPSNILLSGKYRDVQGGGAMGYDFDSGYRISECYAKLAKNVAKSIKKVSK